MTIINMNYYSKIIYEISTKITQGCIIQNILKLNIKRKGLYDDFPFALFIIENACNLVKEKGRTTVDRVEYILLYDATPFIDNLKIKANYIKIGEFIQNRRFESEYFYLPPHYKYKDHPDGFYGLCKDSAFIKLKLLEKLELKDYLCVSPPFRDYIKNKHAYFKIIIPLEDITDDEALGWIFNRELSKGDKTYEELKTTLKGGRKANEFKENIEKLIKKGILKEMEGNTFTYNKEYYEIKENDDE